MLVRNLYKDSGGIHTPWTRLEGACEQADRLNNSQAFRTRPQALPTRVRLSVLEVARLDPLEIIMATREPVEVLYSFPARLSVPRRLFFEYALQKGGDLDAKPRLTAGCRCSSGRSNRSRGTSCRRCSSGRSSKSRGFRSTAETSRFIVVVVVKLHCAVNCSRLRSTAPRRLTNLNPLSTLLSRAAARHFFLDIGPEIRSTLGSRLRSTAASLLRNSGPLFTRIHCLAKSKRRVLARHPPIASGGGLKRGSSTASAALMLEPNIA